MALPNDKQKRFVVYTRISVEDNTRGDSCSIQTQESHCKSMLDAFGHKYVRTVKDDGFSGKDLHRPGLQSLLKEISSSNQNRTFDGIVFLRLDRLSRNTRNIYDLIELFNEKGVLFISVNEKLDSGHAMGRAIIGIMAVLSALEREQIGERVRVSCMARIKQGKWLGGILPYGYKLTNDGIPGQDGIQRHNRVINEDIGPKLKVIWQMAVDKKSLLVIAKKLEAMGVKSPTGKPWRKQSLLNILRNPFYKGYVHLGQEIHKSTVHKPIIDEATWERANKVCGSRLPGHGFVPKPKSYIYLLEGLLRCGKCNSHYITTNSVGHGGGRYHYYICGRKQQGLGCEAGAITAQAFDQTFIQYLKESAADRKVIIDAIKEAARETKEKLSSASREIQKGQKQLKILTDESEKLLNLALGGTISKGSTYRTRLEKLETEMALIEDNLSKLDSRKRAAEMTAASTDIIHSNIIYVMDNFDKADPEAQKSFIQSILKEVVIFDDHIEIVMFIGPVIKQPAVSQRSSTPPYKVKRPGNISQGVNHLREGSLSRQFWLPERGKHPNFSITIYAGLNNSKNGERWSLVV